MPTRTLEYFNNVMRTVLFVNRYSYFKIKYNWGKLVTIQTLQDNETLKHLEGRLNSTFPMLIPDYWICIVAHYNLAPRDTHVGN